MFVIMIGILVILLAVQLFFGIVLIPRDRSARVKKVLIYGFSTFILEFIILVSMNWWVDPVLNRMYDLTEGSTLDTAGVVVPVGLLIMCWALVIDRITALAISQHKGIVRAGGRMLVQGIISAVLMFVVFGISRA